MDSSTRPGRLGEFLKARRAQLSPRALGLPGTPGPRPDIGLRREEVAVLAAISTDYYTGLEEGHIQAPARVLETLAEALRMDEAQRARLFELAGDIPGQPARQAVQSAQPGLRQLLAQLNSTAALIVGRRMDILDWNPLASALITEFADVPASQRNFTRLIFTDPDMRELFPEWTEIARSCVLQLRREVARDPGNTGLTGLIGELSYLNADFRRLWATRQAAGRAAAGPMPLRHPVVGELTLDWDTLASANGSDQYLLIWSAEAGTPSANSLRFLASWATPAPGVTPLPDDCPWHKGS